MPKKNLTLREYILIDHIEHGRSLRAIERAHDLANGCLSRYARRHHLPVRSKTEQIRQDFASGTRQAPIGAQHWSWGLRKETNAIMARHSARMTAHNPMQIPEIRDKAQRTRDQRGFRQRMRERMQGRPIPEETRQKIARTVAPQLLKRLSQREQVMQKALLFDPRWIPQYQVDCAVLDFARPDLQIALEIDVGGHKLQRALERDLRLVRAGWMIFRCRADKGLTRSYYTRLLRIAEQVFPELQCPDKLPTASRHQYGVVIRCAQYPTGVRIYRPHDPLLRELRAARGHTPPAATVR